MAKEVVRAAPPRQTKELPTQASEPARVDAATTVAAGVLTTLGLTAPAPVVPAPAPVAAPVVEAPLADEPPPVIGSAAVDSTTAPVASAGATAAAADTSEPVDRHLSGVPSSTDTDSGPQTQALSKTTERPVDRASRPASNPKNQVVFLASDVVRRRLKMFTVREVHAVAVSSIVAYAVEKLLDAMTDDEIAGRIAALGHGLRRGKGPTTENPLYLAGSKKNQVAFLTTDTVKRRIKMFTVRDVDPIAEGMVAMFAVGRLFESMLDDEIAAHVAALEEAAAAQARSLTA
jgi:hypothetical protein